MVALVLFTQSALFSRAVLLYLPLPLPYSFFPLSPPLFLLFAHRLSFFFFVAKDKHKKKLRFISWSNISSVLIFPHCYCCNMKQLCTLSLSPWLLLSSSLCLSVCCSFASFDMQPKQFHCLYRQIKNKPSSVGLVAIWVCVCVGGGVCRACRCICVCQCVLPVFAQLSFDFIWQKVQRFTN